MLGRLEVKQEKAMHYVAVVNKDPDSTYGIRFPEAPGCFSAADSFEDILPNAIEALALYFEDGDEAQPRGLEAVREEVAEEIAAGAVLILVPYLADRRRTVRVNFSIDKGLLDTLDEAARMLGISRSAFLAKAAAREIRDPAS